MALCNKRLGVIHDAKRVRWAESPAMCLLNRAKTSSWQDLQLFKIKKRFNPYFGLNGTLNVRSNLYMKLTKLKATKTQHRHSNDTRNTSVENVQRENPFLCVTLPASQALFLGGYKISFSIE